MFEVKEGCLWAAPEKAGKRGRDSVRGANALSQKGQSLLLVCKSNLERECIFNGLVMNGLKLAVICRPSIDHGEVLEDVAAVMIHIGSKRLADPFFSGEMQSIIDKWRPVPVVFLAEREEWAQVVRAMEIGARGYIPTSVDTRVCVEAIHLATAGGMYVPASMVTKPAAVDIDEDVLGELLTAREVEVVHAIRLGRSNKVIAYELGMSEGTVKAHVHNIMKKIGAANRTEVACMLHKMYGNMQNEN
ncbi:LuxR family transcriptional regulator [Brucella sp. 10RB9215]|uniref:response regulator transcription factor n=1 Tax=Brucella sp. 10RB9215 TaxID=1149953 RepID=UPI0009095C7E|nr:response regulator transcription factor [Brucella sp. 10RB9215]SBW15205.1 LuxR family transcriptional regulator [Brucella sp. 10RB9215]